MPLLLLASSSCGDDSAGPKEPRLARLQLLSPPTSSGTSGWPLADSIVVEAVDEDGRGVSGVPLKWQTTSPTGTINPSADTTDARGQTSAEWTMGLEEGQQSLTVSTPQGQSVTLGATAGVFHAQGVTVGRDHACALTSAGEAFCWGGNGSGQLGIPTTTAASDIPVAVVTTLRFSSVVASDSYSCALTLAGAAYCWGSNHEGRLGSALAGSNTSTPTPVSGGLSFSQLSARYGSQPATTCGLTAVTGEVWCWGQDAYGMLGTAVFDTVAKFTPVPVRAVDSSGFAGVYVGDETACAWTAAGALSCWGMLPDSIGSYGTRPISRTPVAVAAGLVVTGVATGWGWGCALNDAARVYCWGSNWTGVLGWPGVSYSSVPVPISNQLDFLAMTSTTWSELFGVTTSGELYRWGSPDDHFTWGQPVQSFLPALGFAQIDGGQLGLGNPRRVSSACGVSLSGAVYCFGVNAVGVGPFGIPVPASGARVGVGVSAFRR